MELILFFLSALPVVLLGLFIYKKDKNKEPGKLLLKLFLGGICACFLVFFVSVILEILFPIFDSDVNSLNRFELIIYVFIGIALVEEVCKWLIVYKISYNDYEFEELFDMIVYCVFVALGFAFFENLLYVYEGGIQTGIMRALLAVPGHACDGVFMGYYLGLAKESHLHGKDGLRIKYMLLSIIVPTLMHGFYDYCLMTNNGFFVLLFLIFVVIVYVITFKKVKKVSSINRKMKYEDNFCPNCGTVVNSNYCPSCGRENR